MPRQLFDLNDADLTDTSWDFASGHFIKIAWVVLLAGGSVPFVQ